MCVLVTVSMCVCVMCGGGGVVFGGVEVGSVVGVCACVVMCVCVIVL